MAADIASFSAAALPARIVTVKSGIFVLPVRVALATNPAPVTHMGGAMGQRHDVDVGQLHVRTASTQELAEGRS
ncbi:MAG: hypothetical protein QOD04_5546 [Pseudonocardiales bacterium]|nr:hypothetical protein [Pseudonocardiales bacterium]